MPGNVWKAPYGRKSGDWIVLSQTKLSGAATTYDFPVTLADALYTGYRVTIHYVNGYAGSSAAVLRINGATAKANKQRLIAADAVIGSGRNTDYDLHIGSAAIGLYETLFFDIAESLASIDGRKANSWLGTDTSALQLLLQGADVTTPAATTEITSLGVGANYANGLGANTVLRLYARIL